MTKWLFGSLQSFSIFVLAVLLLFTNVIIQKQNELNSLLIERVHVLEEKVQHDIVVGCEIMTLQSKRIDGMEKEQKLQRKIILSHDRILTKHN